MAEMVETSFVFHQRKSSRFGTVNGKVNWVHFEPLRTQLFFSSLLH